MTDIINPDNLPIKKQEHNFAHGNLEVEEFESYLDIKHPKRKKCRWGR